MRQCQGGESKETYHELQIDLVLSSYLVRLWLGDAHVCRYMYLSSGANNKKHNDAVLGKSQ